MKTFTIILTVVIAVICVGVAYQSNKKATSSINELEQERYSRMVAEESLEKTKLQVQSLQAQVTKVKLKNDDITERLDKAVSINSDLKGRLDKAAGIQKVLQTQIKELQKLSSQL